MKEYLQIMKENGIEFGPDVIADFEDGFEHREVKANGGAIISPWGDEWEFAFAERDFGVWRRVRNVVPQQVRTNQAKRTGPVRKGERIRQVRTRR
jgi:hypothetical protein